MSVRCLILAWLVFGGLARPAACQEPPRLCNMGPAVNPPHGGLEGFHVYQLGKPQLSPKQLARAEGSRSAATLTVVDGKTAKVHIEGDGPLAGALRRAVRKWRYDMPRDGSSPMYVKVVFVCKDAKVDEDGIEVALRVADLGQPAGCREDPVE